MTRFSCPISDSFDFLSDLFHKSTKDLRFHATFVAPTRITNDACNQPSYRTMRLTIMNTTFHLTSNDSFMFQR